MHMFAAEIMRLFNTVDLHRLKADLEYAVVISNILRQFLTLLKGHSGYSSLQNIRSALWEVFPWPSGDRNDITVRELSSIFPDKKRYISDEVLDLSVEAFYESGIPCKIQELSMYLCLTGGIHDATNDELDHCRDLLVSYKRKEKRWDPSPHLYRYWIRAYQQCKSE